MARATAVVIGGTCDPRFEPVKAAFDENFMSRDEVGAAVCVWAEGRKVVDLWGGWADRDRTVPWQGDTLVNVFSVGKGLVAALAANAVGARALSVDEPVVLRWPEFGAEAKDSITVRQLLTHEAALPAVRRRLDDEAVLDWPTIVDALAAERTWWTPGDGHGYHVNTFGFLVGEVLRRAFGDGATVGALLRDRIAGPLGADVYIGLPASMHWRVAEFLWPAGAGPPEVEDLQSLPAESLLEYCAYWNPRTFSGGAFVNDPRWRMAEVPSTNGHASARGVARVYGALAGGGVLGGERVVDRFALAEATVEQVSGDDRVLHRPSRFGLGFQLTQPERQLGPSPLAFGHFGAGGSLGFADPDNRVGFGYVMNAMGPRWQNPRNRALIDSVYEALGS